MKCAHCLKEIVGYYVVVRTEKIKLFFHDPCYDAFYRRKTHEGNASKGFIAGS